MSRRLSKDEIEDEIQETEMSDTNKAVSSATNELDAASEEFVRSTESHQARNTLHDVIAAQPHEPAPPVQHPGAVVIEPSSATRIREPLGRAEYGHQSAEAVTPAEFRRSAMLLQASADVCGESRSRKRAGVELKPTVTILSK